MRSTIGRGYALSIGNCRVAIYKTIDAGGTWTLQFTNTDEQASSMRWRSDPDRGVASSDSVDSRFIVLTTGNGGRSWELVDQKRLPPALAGEGAYAANGTNVVVNWTGTSWIATSSGRVLRSTMAAVVEHDETPLATGASAGPFSIAFRDPSQDWSSAATIARRPRPRQRPASTDGRDLVAPDVLSGFRSVVATSPV